MEFYGQVNTRTVRKKEDVWFKTSQRKRVYVEIFFYKHYKTEHYGAVSCMIYAVKKIIIKQIGDSVLPYQLVVFGVNIPIKGRGYIHEDSPLYALLNNIQDMAKRIG